MLRRVSPYLLTIAALATSVSADAGHQKLTFWMKDRAAFDSLIASLDTYNQAIDAWAVEPDGDWVVVTGGSVYHTAGMSKTITDAAKLNLFFGRTIRAIDCRADGMCVMVHSAGAVSSTGAFPAGLWDAISYYINTAKVPIRDLELTPGDGWVLLAAGSNASYSAAADLDLRNAVYDRRASGRVIADIDVDFAGKWVLMADNSPMSDGVGVGFLSELEKHARAETNPERFLSGRNGDFVIFNGDDSKVVPVLSDPVDAMEYDLGVSSRNIWTRMDALGIPGMAIAVIDGNRVVSARGYGHSAHTAHKPILGSTPFDVASLSKYVGGLTVLAVDDANASVDLDTDIFDMVPADGHVDTWRDRLANESEDWGFTQTALPAEGFTLRQLMSHTGGIIEGGSTEISSAIDQRASCDVDTVDFMSGIFDDGSGECVVDTSGNSAVWWQTSNGRPGFDYNYSNASVYLAQATIEDMTGSEGRDLARTLVFNRLGLTRTTGAYPLPTSWLEIDAGQSDPSVGNQLRATYPWTFSGGITSSVDDYAEMVIVGLNDGVASDNTTRVLSSSAVDDLLTRVGYTNFAANPNSYGIGVGLGNVGGDFNADNDDGVFRHAGAHPGRVSTFMCGNPTQDQGLVIFINANDESDDNDGINAFVSELRAAYQDAVAWPSGC
jgi:CubicO group peptidase (beta-lactamase class C family)